MSDTEDRPPLWKQLAGAAIGGTLALALYYGYEAGSPKLMAYLTIPGGTTNPGDVRVSDTDEDQELYDRIASRAKQIAEKFESRSEREIKELTDALDVPDTAMEDPAPKYAVPEPASAPPEIRTLDSTKQLAKLYDNTVQEGVASGPVGINFEDSMPASDYSADVVASNAPGLPNSGLPGVIVALGAGMGGAWVRRRRV